MEPIPDTLIPNIAMLAYRYGTINKNEFKLVNKLYNERPGQPSFNKILLNQGFATEYQIDLLNLIQDYHIIQKQGVEFGKIAFKKGFATQKDIETALLVQKTLLKKEKLKRLIGDILVKSNVITIEQKDEILLLQKTIEQKPSLFIDNILVKKKVISHDQKDIVLAEQKKLLKSKKNENRFFSELLIAVSDDNMEAYAIIDKSGNNKPVIPLAKLKKKLEQKKIKQGILSDSLIQCYIDNNYTMFPIAMGTCPVEYGSQAVDYFFDINNLNTDQVKKGESLAEQKISGKGFFAKDVFGNSIERDNLENKTENLIRCGYGTRLSKDGKKAFAGKTGMPLLSVHNKLFIHPVVNILEDADLRYGKIEKYANLNISGTLTDAFPVIAGNLKAKEIRGTKLDVFGNINVDLGITGATIRCQGSIKAKYIKNSTIEAFGDVFVHHEIIDSKIIISGKVQAPLARVISSSISAKNSITIGALGSRVTEPCELSAGRDDHILLEFERIDMEIKHIRTDLDDLRKQREKNIIQAERLFKKMIQLKRFHDNIDKKKKKLENDIALIKEKNLVKEDQRTIKKTQILLNKLKNKTQISITSLKAINNEKKRIDLLVKRIEKRIEKIEPEINKRVGELEIDRSMVFSWVSDKPYKSEINIKSRVSESTIFKGIFSKKVLKKDFKKIIVKEIKIPGKDNQYSLKLYKG